MFGRSPLVLTIEAAAIDQELTFVGMFGVFPSVETMAAQGAVLAIALVGF